MSQRTMAVVMGLILGCATSAAVAGIGPDIAQVFGHANQSTSWSTWDYTMAAGAAIDGNIGTPPWADTNTGDFKPWWQVDLGSTFVLTEIDVWAQPNWSERDNDGIVSILNSAHATVWTGALPPSGSPAWLVQKFTLPTTLSMVSGEFIRIDNTKEYGIDLTEVQAFGEQTPEPATLSLLALGGAMMLRLRRRS